MSKNSAAKTKRGTGGPPVSPIVNHQSKKSKIMNLIPPLFCPLARQSQQLVAHLLDHPGFHTAAQLHQRLGFSDRTIRKLAESSGGLIISGPGSPGYCHLDHCPVEKLNHIANTLQSQGKLMLRRSIAMRRKAHQRL